MQHAPLCSSPVALYHVEYTLLYRSIVMPSVPSAAALQNLLTPPTNNKQRAIYLASFILSLYRKLQIMQNIQHFLFTIEIGTVSLALKVPLFSLILDCILKIHFSRFGTKHHGNTTKQSIRKIRD